MDMPSEKISVIVAAYNAEETLRESIQSILNQTYSNLEIIIVDDKSKDGTLSLAQELAKSDARIRVIAAEKNGGPARARNAALEIATGDWVAVVDSDDLILPERFAALLSAGQTSNADIIFDNMFYIVVRNNTEHMYVPSNLDIFGDLPLSTFIASHRKSVPIPSLGFLKPMIRRSAIESHSLRYETSLLIGEDARLIMELMAQGNKAILLPEAYYRYHRHDGSISAVQSMDNLRAVIAGYETFLAKYGAALGDVTIKHMRDLIDDCLLRIRVDNIASKFRSGDLVNGIFGLCKAPHLIAAVARNIAGHMRRYLRTRKNCA